MSLFFKLQSYMNGRKYLIPAALILSAISALFGMAPYILIWYIIKELFTAGENFSSEIISLYAWWSLGTAITGVIVYFAALSLSHLAAFRVEANMRRYSMQKIVRMPFGFFDNNATGRIRKIIDDNATITHNFLAHQMPDFAATILMPLTVLILIFLFDWRLGFVCMIPVLFSIFIMGWMMGKKGRYFMKNYMTSLEEMNSEAVEYVRGIPVVKVFQQTVFSFKNFYNSIIKYKNMVFSYTKLWEKPMSAYTVIINSFVFLLIPATIIIINTTGNYALTILNMFLYVLITPVFSQCIMRSIHLNQAIFQANEAVVRIENLTNYKLLSVSDKPKHINGNEIQFSNVSFSYPGSNKNAVDKISFIIPSGKTVALVGASGSGKTTIARLVLRYWDVDKGAVTIGGTNVNEIISQELMNHISYVLQNTVLFKTSLLNNIRYGNPQATVSDVINASELAQCSEFIKKLPSGLYTKIGTEGTYLSGGEQQRIVLARAILKNAPIIVLDEATAFTDPENEHLIRQALKKLTQGKTVLIIAHRLSSIIDADNILLINDGKIAGQGTHNELLQKNELYKKMWNEYCQSVKWKIKKEDDYA